MHTKSLTKCLTLTMSTTRGCTDGALRMWTAMRYQFAIPIQKVQSSGWTWRSRSVELGNLMWWQTQLLPSPSTCTSSTWRRSWLYRHMLKKPWQGRKKGCKSWVRNQSCVRAKSMFVSWERLGGRFDSIAIWNRSETQKHVGDLTMKCHACMDDVKLYETSNLTHSTFELKLQTSTVKLLEAPWHFPCQRCHFGFVSEAPRLFPRFAVAMPMSPYKQHMINLLREISCERLCLSCALPMVSSFLDEFLGNAFI